MLPTKYHALIFIGILVMLLLLGLHLLGVGLTGGGGGGANQAAAARTAALARNSSATQASSSSINTPAYRHPIVYDKLTGATNNQISEVLGASKQQPTADYPIDHYSQRQQQDPYQQQLPPQQQLPQDDFFGLHRPAGFPPLHMMGPPPVPQIPAPPTTQRPPPVRNQPLQMGRQPLVAAVAPAGDGAASGPSSGADSLPSASSLNNNGAQRPLNISSPLTQQQLPANHLYPQTQQQQQQQQQQQLQSPQQSPYYYTPPIFAYNNFDQNRALTEPQYNTAGHHYGFPAQTLQQQQPPLGVPEQPMSVDEYNARQTRLRQLGLLQPSGNNELSQLDRYGGKQQVAPQQNLLAEPRDQNRHKQQMLDRQLLFANNSPYATDPQPANQTHYPDAAYRVPFGTGGVARGPPYAHSLSGSAQQADLEQQQLAALSKPSAQNRILSPSSSLINQPPPPPPPPPSTRPPPERQLIKSQNPAPLILQQQQQVSGSQSAPLCSRQVPPAGQQVPLEAANSSGQLPALFCNEDTEYPTKEIMRALELYATERSIEQLLPQMLVQLQMAAPPVARGQQGAQSVQLADLQRQLSLDSLQPSIGALGDVSTNQQQVVAFDEQRSQPLPNIFPSANYESLCRSTVYMAQPKRAKNLLGQWKVVVNLPGHKYRGIAVSQMVRVEECSRPNGECALPPANTNGRAVAGAGQQVPIGSRTRCLQHYENQRLVAWSHQQGLHLDIFRVPIACSCHIRR